MVEIAEAEHAAGGNHVALVNAQSDGGAECEAKRGGDQDQKKNFAPHTNSLSSTPAVSGREDRLYNRELEKHELLGDADVVRLFSLPPGL
jgi:hypothetical protein